MLSPERPIWRPYTQEGASSPAVELARAYGATLETTKGQKIFDGISSWWLTTHGHSHPHIVEGVRRQAERLSQVTFANFTHEPAERLAEMLSTITPPELTRVFLTDNGSTAVEVALKMALQASAQTGRPERKRILAFEGAYHGDTVGAMSVSARGDFTRPYRETLFDVVRAPRPSDPEFAEIFARNAATLAAVIVEPLIQAAGGMLVWPDEELRTLAKLCRERDVILIFDEVMTGFGRTGSLFAMDRAGVVPDLLCLSKGLTGGTLPLAATLAREEIYRAFHSPDKSKMLFHGHSFTGNALSCAAAVANLELFREPEAIAKLERLTRAQATLSEQAARRLPVRERRVCGTMAALELDLDETGYLAGFSGHLMEVALDEGLFVRPLGHVIYLLPPYCTTETELEDAWGRLTEVTVRVLSKLG